MFIFYYGSRGEVIRFIQNQFKQLGYLIQTDGIYGNQTIQVVEQFQKEHEIEVTGQVDENTFKKLMIVNHYPESFSSVNSHHLPSSTDYLVWADQSTHRVRVYTGKNHLWKEVRNCVATFGKKSTPTLKGIFFVGIKEIGYGGPRYGFKVKWVTQYYHNYLFHSILYNLDGSVFDDRLGLDLSDGCIRLSAEDALYLYDRIPTSTTVWVT